MTTDSKRITLRDIWAELRRPKGAPINHRANNLICDVGGAMIIPTGLALGAALFILPNVFALHTSPSASSQRMFYNPIYHTVYADPAKIPCKPYPAHPSEFTDEQWIAFKDRCPD